MTDDKEENAFDNAAINAAALAAKSDPARLEDLIAHIYPFLLWRARQISTSGSLHDPEDLASEALPWVSRALARWSPDGPANFMTYIWKFIGPTLASLARRQGRSMARPWEPSAKSNPTFTALDAPLSGDSDRTLADTLIYDHESPEIGALQEMPTGLLPDEEREILHAHYCEGKTWSEIARERRSTRQNIHQRAAKGIRRLRKLYDEQRAKALASAG